MVGFGAAQVLNEALSERPVGGENVNDESTDLKNDAYDFDSSLYAAFAYADCASWESGSDKQKRLEFWTWWLTSAVRDATND